jgi:hypothetical protein
MQDSKTVTANTGTGGQIVAWIALLFVLILLCLLPFLVGGVVAVIPKESGLPISARWAPAMRLPLRSSERFRWHNVCGSA